MFSPPKIQPPAPPPTINDARKDAEEADAFLKRSGRQSTFASTPASRMTGGYDNKTLTGQG